MQPLDWLQKQYNSYQLAQGKHHKTRKWSKIIWNSNIASSEITAIKFVNAQKNLEVK